MKKQLQLTIHEPCHENWDAMTPVDKGRFCGQCKKEVVDFTNMSDRQLAEFFKKPSSGSVCGRFMTGQLERDIEIPRKRIPWIKYFFQFALPAFLLSLKATSAKAQGQVIVKSENKPAGTHSSKTKNDTLLMPEVVITVQNNLQPVLVTNPPGCYTPVELSKGLTGKLGCVVVSYTQPVSIAAIRDLSISALDRKPITGTDTSSRIIKGITNDESGIPLPGISVRIKGTSKGTASDKNGSFLLEVKLGDVLVAIGVGCAPIEKMIADEDSVTLILPRITMGGISYKKIKQKRSSDISPIKNEVFAKTEQGFKIFPNPVNKGDVITIACKKPEAGNYILQLLTIAGQSVFQHVEVLGKKSKQITLNLPALIPGEYLIVLAHPSSGTKYTEKIIIQ